MRGYYWGGILNYGVLTLTNSVLSNNPSRGIYNYGILVLNSSSIHDNQAYHGGGIYNNNGTVVLNSSSIMSNSVHVFGGGVLNDHGNLIMNNSIIANNTACNQSCPFTALRLPMTALPDTG